MAASDPAAAEPDPIPINPGGLVDPDHLVGRREDLASVIDTLERSHGVALTGERRHGKTAFSGGVEQEAYARGWTVITQSLEGTRTADEVMAVLARVLVAALPSMARATAWLKSRAELKAGPLSIPRTTLTLDDLLNEACGHASRVLLILDELPICAREIERSAPGAGLAVLHTLRRSRYQNDPKLTMLCLGSIGFHHVVPHLDGSVSDLDKHPLMPLTAPFASELATRLLASTDIPPAIQAALAPAMAVASEGVPYYLHHLAIGCKRRHARGQTLASDVPAHLVTEAIDSPDDPWDLKHYVTRVPVYYPDAALAAAAVLDIIAAQPCDLDFLRNALDADPRDFSDVDLPGIVVRLEQDHYIQRRGTGTGTRSFRSDIVRRAWLRWRT